MAMSEFEKVEQIIADETNKFMGKLPPSLSTGDSPMLPLILLLISTAFRYGMYRAFSIATEEKSNAN
jgi:hypothetical protein